MKAKDSAKTLVRCLLSEDRSTSECSYLRVALLWLYPNDTHSGKNFSPEYTWYFTRGSLGIQRDDRLRSNCTYRFLVTTLVIACLIVVPAFSRSLFESPIVAHTLRAGGTCQTISFAWPLSVPGGHLSRVIMTPFARLYLARQW